jgi:hypothetical protein
MVEHKNPDPHCNYAGEEPCKRYALRPETCEKCLWWDEPGTSLHQIEIKRLNGLLHNYKLRVGVLANALIGVGKELCNKRRAVLAALEEFNDLRSCDEDYNEFDTNWIYREIKKEKEDGQ